VAQTKSNQSNPARAGSNRVGSAGSRGGSRGTATGSGSSSAASPLPLTSGRGGRRTGNPFALIGNFIRDVRSELRKVAWPTRHETLNLTIVVIALSVVVGVFLGGVDYIFQELFKTLLQLTGSGGA